MKFKVKDNFGRIHLSKEYEWDKYHGIPDEETILEEMEECNCSLNENNPYCDGSCCIFEHGEVVEVLKNEE
jgi:CDGSH-type Zn-finger protein